VRAAVYNRYWPTGGGGEAYGAGVAHVLRQHAEVDLLCHEPVDVAWLSERLRVPLDGVRSVVLPDAPTSVTDAAATYDVFVNVSFMSNDMAPSPRSLYVVHFPNPPELHLSKPRKAVVRGLRSLSRAPGGVDLVSGFYDRSPGLRGERWTDGDAVALISLPPGPPVALRVVFGASRPEATEVAVELDGALVSTVSVGGPGGIAARRRATVVVPGSAAPRAHELRLRSGAFTPADAGGRDRRRLGVPVRGIRIGRSAHALVETWLPWVGARAEPGEWQRTYGALLANSAFTASWVERWWSIRSEVLYPPVTIHPRGDKDPIILSVGRFFAAEQGHSKKQLEMVRTFRRLVDQGLRGWSLHLVGGCEDVGRPYLERVREAANGYPVEVHVDAPGKELADLYARAAIYWHAAGLGESPSRHPGRLEHFGMTTVEAMSAGAVPVVVGLAGQTETVRHGVDGFHFRTLAELAELTRVLIDDELLRVQMSSSAEGRARQFSLDAFSARFWEIVDRLPEVVPVER
jgi:glycosyltransferase involved in cell wall biosynthesis